MTLHSTQFLAHHWPRAASAKADATRTLGLGDPYLLLAGVRGYSWCAPGDHHMLNGKGWRVLAHHKAGDGDHRYARVIARRGR